jgi:hypothetical protein
MGFRTSSGGFLNLNANHIIGIGAAPTIVVSNNAGLGNGNQTASISGNDDAGNVTITTGNAPGLMAWTLTFAMATVTFGRAYASAPKSVVITPANFLPALWSSQVAWYCTQASITTTSFTVNLTVMNGGGVTLNANSAFQYMYLVVA